MSNPVPSNRLSFEENIGILLEELVLADKWQRPSILLAVHKSKFGQDKAAKALEDKLNGLGHTVIRITVDKEHSDVPHLVLGAPSAGESIFFISNIDWGGGADRKDAYRALNIYREIFVDNHFKAVLWLTTNEAAGLARFAPDFWAFRHRVVEFSGQRVPRQVELPAGVLLWDIQNSVDPYDTLEARIAVREELLARLPDSSEARSARIDLLYNLGYLYWVMGRTETASEEFKLGLELAAKQDARAGVPLLNGQGILAYEARDYERSSQLFQKAGQYRPTDASLVLNLGIALSALGRNYEAIAQAKKGMKLSPRDPRIWSTAAYLNAAIGKLDEAIIAFNHAAELAPRTAAFHAALAICYDQVGRNEEAARELDLARELTSGKGQVSIQIYEAAISGDISSALDLARAAVRRGHLSPQELRRDPSLGLMLDPTQIEASLA